MNREKLIEQICPAHARCKVNCEDCDVLLNAMLDNYEKHVRADAIEEFRVECESASYIPLGYEFYVTDMKDIRKIAELLKEQNNGE